MLQIGTGQLGWKPREFWRATLIEYYAAIDGMNEMNMALSGQSPDDQMTPERYDELKAMYPDGHRS